MGRPNEIAGSLGSIQPGRYLRVPLSFSLSNSGRSFTCHWRFGAAGGVRSIRLLQAHFNKYSKETV